MKPKEPILKKGGNIDFSAYSEQEKFEVLEYIFKDTRYENTQSKDFLFNENEEINIDLWPSKKWTKEELESFENVFTEFGETSGQISNEPRGIAIETAIYFISAAIAAGFFGKCGSDAYDFLKGGLKDLLLKRGKNAKLDDAKLDGYLNLKYDDINTNTKFYYACFYSSEEEISCFFSNIHKIDYFIHNAQKLDLFPFNKGTGFDVHVEFGQKTNYDWDIHIRRYIEEERLIVFNETQMSVFKTQKLDELQWKNIMWEQISCKTDLESLDEYTFRKLKEMTEKK